LSNSDGLPHRLHLTAAHIIKLGSANRVLNTILKEIEHRESSRKMRFFVVTTVQAGTDTQIAHA
jgi:hypothetical protein